MRNQLRRTSFRLALCGLMTALGTALMAAGGLIPVATYATPLYVQMLLVPVLTEFGPREGLLVWGATALLSLMLCPDREAAVLYLLAGYYPVLKPVLDRLPGPLARGAKLVFFTLVQILLCALLIWVFQMQQVAAELASTALWLNLTTGALLVAVLMIYDRLLERLVPVYLKKLRPRLPRWREDGKQ